MSDDVSDKVARVGEVHLIAKVPAGSVIRYTHETGLTITGPDGVVVAVALPFLVPDPRPRADPS